MGLHKALAVAQTKKWEWRESQLWTDQLYISASDYTSESLGIQRYLEERMDFMAAGVRQRILDSGYQQSVDVEYVVVPPGSTGDPLDLPIHLVRARTPRYLWVNSDCVHDMKPWSYQEGGLLYPQREGCECGACSFRNQTYDTGSDLDRVGWTPDCAHCGEPVILVDPPEPTYIDVEGPDYYHLECWEERVNDAWYTHAGEEYVE